MSFVCSRRRLIRTPRMLLGWPSQCPLSSRSSTIPFARWVSPRTQVSLLLLLLSAPLTITVGAGMEEFFAAVGEAVNEYHTEYVPLLQQLKQHKACEYCVSNHPCIGSYWMFIDSEGAWKAASIIGEVKTRPQARGPCSRRCIYRYCFGNFYFVCAAHASLK